MFPNYKKFDTRNQIDNPLLQQFATKAKLLFANFKEKLGLYFWLKMNTGIETIQN